MHVSVWSRALIHCVVPIILLVCAHERVRLCARVCTCCCAWLLVWLLVYVDALACACCCMPCSLTNSNGSSSIVSIPVPAPSNRPTDRPTNRMNMSHIITTSGNSTNNMSACMYCNITQGCQCMPRPIMLVSKSSYAHNSDANACHGLSCWSVNHRMHTTVMSMHATAYHAGQ
jgi:hypothetical protein